MRYTVFGAGAVGGIIAARLARVAEVGVLSRGAGVRAIRQDGLTLIDTAGGHSSIHIDVADEPGELPPAAVVLVATKAHSLPSAAGAIARALKPGGLAVFVQNGLPWWYLRDRQSPSAAGRSSSLDPDGSLDAAFPTCGAGVTYMGGAVVAPAVVRHVAVGKTVIGAAGRSEDHRLAQLARDLTRAGLPTEVAADVGNALWRKLVVNLALNGPAVLTRRTIDEMLSSATLRPVI